MVTLLLSLGDDSFPAAYLLILKGLAASRCSYILWGSILQVYVTMYLNDCQRTDFYEGIGLDTKEFDMHVIIEVNLVVILQFNTLESQNT